ncbi:MAG TPA: hypothetical protein VFJ30_02665 [Phycisphaerae bacterium]|nr:hypothetical protein [Phycisphaerae bacterium]
MFKREIRASILSLWFLSAGGLLLHIRIHRPGADLFFWIPVAFGVMTTFAVPVLFNFRRTVTWAYVLNLATVIVGTVTMAYFAARTWQGPVTWDTVLLRSTLPDILILWAKLPLGEHILRHFRQAEAAERAGGAS